MSGLLSRFSWDNPQWNYQVMACLVIIWLAVLFCALSSINSQNWSSRQRIFWIVVVCALPVVGLLLYIPFSVRLENYPHLKMLRKEMRH